MKLKPIPNQNGIIGVAVYWLEWALDLIPIAFFAYNIYLCTLLALQYWIKVNGSSAFICVIFAIIFSLLSAVANILRQFSFIESLQEYIKYIYYIVTIISLLIHAVMLQFFTPISYYRSSTDFYEYTMSHNQTDSVANHYYNLYINQQYEIQKILWDRTITQKIPLASFFIIWSVCFSLYFLGSNYTECQKPSNSAYQQSSQLQPNDQSDLQLLHHIPEDENEEINSRNETEINDQ